MLHFQTWANMRGGRCFWGAFVLKDFVTERTGVGEDVVRKLLYLMKPIIFLTLSPHAVDSHLSACFIPPTTQSKQNAQ